MESLLKYKYLLKYWPLSTISNQGKKWPLEGSDPRVSQYQCYTANLLSPPTERPADQLKAAGTKQVLTRQ